MLQDNADSKVEDVAPSELSTDAPNSQSPEKGPTKRELYDSQSQSNSVDGLPNLGLDTTVDPGVRTHGAASVSDETYWSGHILGLVLLAIGIILIVLARGPRKKDALHQLHEQKVAATRGSKKSSV